MDKYINSTKVLNFIQDCLNHEDKISDTEKATLIAIQRYIERIQIEDVAPVRHGKWIVKIDPWDRQHIGKCSECGQTYCDYEYFCFCPHCGTKMDGESNV